MRSKGVIYIILTCCIFFVAAVSFGEERGKQGSSDLFFDSDRYEFSPVVDGTKITHDFIIVNGGEKPVKIIKVNAP